MIKQFKKFTLKTIQAAHFIMCPLELHEYIPFGVKRVYYIFNTTGDSGQHCHFIEEELFIMVQGSCTAVIDKGEGKEDVLLEPHTAIYVPAYVWHGFKNFSKDAILLALSSTNYSPDRSDYLEDYEEYLKIRDEKLRREAS